MKILISTLHFYNNFGSVLQAYALRQTLIEKFDAAVSISDYRPTLPEWKYFATNELQNEYAKKQQKFINFRCEHLGMGEGTRNPKRYDAYIVGSDIVWGMEFSALDSDYFLEHACQDAMKIAYAASVILDKNGHTEDDTKFAQYLPNFDAISVRETSAVEVIQRFTNTKVEAVLDPTLLLDRREYESLEIENEDMKGKSYLLSYFLTHDPAVVDYTNLIARRLGLRVIHYFADYPDRVFDSDAGCFAFAGPGEFLGYVKNAAMVFTNSFHGTCFSIIYRKPFYTYTAKRAMLSRVKDTIARLGLEGRYFSDFRDLAKVSMEIDYNECKKRLRKEQEKSLEFLKRALEGEA